MARIPKDPLAQWFRHTVIVTRPAGESAYGLVHSTPVGEKAQIADKARLVRNAAGNEVVSTTTVAFAHGTAHVPVDSEITLPASFGGRTARVVAVTVADSGGQPTPDHLLAYLE